jgi:isochorismate synthase
MIHSRVQGLALTSPLESADRFVMTSPRGAIAGVGVQRRFTSSLADGLADEVREGLATFSGGGAAPVAVGAFPFDPAGDAHLVIPREVVRTQTPAAPRSDSDVIACPADFVLARTVEPFPTRREYREIVRRALRMITGEEPGRPLEKVVVARTLTLRSREPFRIEEVVEKLRVDPSVTAYAVPLPPRANGPARTLVGATPELLVAKRGHTVTLRPLAGSSRRSANPDLDRRAARALLESDKDRREHAAVIEDVLERLAPYCSRLRAPSSPTLMGTRTVWHLGTAIEGTLKDPTTSSLELAATLHPTPAVCGSPRQAALEAIRALETFDRGFFAGGVGWCDANGDGEWMVAIRCAEIEGNVARLFAGAGVVGGSDPESEASETGAKFEAMLRALDADMEELMHAAEG